MAHRTTYVMQSTIAHPKHMIEGFIRGLKARRPALFNLYSSCQPEHGIGDDASMRQAKLAVESRAFPLFTYDPRRGESLAERLSLTGNPAVKDDWAKTPDGQKIDFLAFARTEGRFAPHFGADGTPSVEIQATQLDRLANWRTLQELAGIR